MKKTTSVVLSVAFLVASISFAKDVPKTNPFKEVLSPVPAAELPAKAADLVLHAKSRARASTTADVIAAAVGINPAAAPAIVGAIAKAVPDMASVAAGVAAAEQPKQAAAIAKAAAAAAPSQARKIVLAVCRAVPNEYRNIAVAVSEVVPSSSSKEIVKAVASAIPSLQPYIEQTLVASGGNVYSVSSTLDQVTKLAQTFPTVAGTPASSPAGTPGQAGTPGTGKPLARGPSVGAPYVPLTVTPSYVNPGTSTDVPAGGRNYAKP